jgi:hypothetical protein
MKLTKLSRINEGFEKLKQLDKEVLAIERLAELVANKKSEIHINLTAVDLEKRAKNEIYLDSDGSLVNRNKPSSGGISSYIFYSSEPPKPPEDSVDVKELIGDVHALELLGLLILQKQQQRVAILNAFRKLGVEV